MTTGRPGNRTTPSSIQSDPFRIGKTAVVFDLDGVIVDSLVAMRQAFTVAYAEVVGPGPAPFDEYERHQGLFFPDIMRIMGLPVQMEEPFVRESYRLQSTVPVFAGVVELLTALRAGGLGLAVATGKAGERARSLLRQLQLLHLFDHVIGSDEIPHPKPAPDIVLEALSRLKTPAHEAVMVGDAPADIRSAIAAGVTPIGALWAPRVSEHELQVAGADLMLEHPGELLELVLPTGLASRTAAS